ncbi:MAG: CinA family protein [Pirellulaceae bacterium]|jgi:nicotinamide-nucleotide amidase|nr:CinA family protein [Pirellulaceae bacterium]
MDLKNVPKNGNSLSEMQQRLQGAAEDLAIMLEHVARVPVVFAESCTAGLVAAALAARPGISRFLCGSAVTYRDDTKHQWLDVPTSLIEQLTSVSAEVTEAMVHSVLRKTPEAIWGAAVTGHLGPDAPPELDGLIYIAIARRLPSDNSIDCEVRSVRLIETARVLRQHEAAEYVLRRLYQRLQSHVPR